MMRSARQPGFFVLVLLLSIGALFFNRIQPATVIGPSRSSGQQHVRAQAPAGTATAVIASYSANDAQDSDREDVWRTS